MDDFNIDQLIRQKAGLDNEEEYQRLVDLCFMEVISFAEDNLSPEDLQAFEKTLDNVESPQIALAYLLEYLKRIPDFREKLNSRLSELLSKEAI